MVAKVRLPIVPGFNRRRTTFDVDLEKVMEADRNGMRVSPLVNLAIIQEQRYQRWLARVGGNGTNAGTRPEGQVYMELERMGYRAPESRPPGMDFEYAPLDPALDDFDLWFTYPPTIVRVQGEYWHFADAAQIAKDTIQKHQAEARGFKVVDILAQDTINPQRLTEVVTLAIQGYEVDPDGRLQIIK